MNIWFAANIPEDSWGGVSRSMRELSSGLQKHGHCTTIVWGTRGVVRGNYLVFAFALCKRLLLHAAQPPDWIIARSTDGVLCALAAKTFRMKTKIALHNHGWEERAYEVEKKLAHDFVARATTWRARSLRFPLLRATLFLCNCCLSGTLVETRWLARRYPLCRKKLRYLPNGVQLGQSPYWNQQPAAGRNFLAVGGNTWKKNIGHSMAVFKNIADHIPGARLFLVGAGFNKGDAPFVLKDLWHDKKDRIEVIPEEKPEFMSQWYKQCPFFISSSRFEGGHSLAILEALSFGCVVFATDIPSTREFIFNKSNGIIIGGINVEDDSKTILEVLSDKDLVARIRHNAFRTAGRNRWERQVNRLEEILCPKH